MANLLKQKKLGIVLVLAIAFIWAVGSRQASSQNYTPANSNAGFGSSQSAVTCTDGLSGCGYILNHQWGQTCTWGGGVGGQCNLSFNMPNDINDPNYNIKGSPYQASVTYSGGTNYGSWSLYGIGTPNPVCTSTSNPPGNPCMTSCSLNVSGADSFTIPNTLIQWQVGPPQCINVGAPTGGANAQGTLKWTFCSKNANGKEYVPTGDGVCSPKATCNISSFTCSTNSTLAWSTSGCTGVKLDGSSVPTIGSQTDASGGFHNLTTAEGKSSTAYCEASANYRWSMDGWGACSATCGGGTQTRTVVCQDSSGKTVSDTYCITNVGPKPPVSQSCNTQACTVPAPTANLTVNGQHNVVVNVGQNLNYAWSSTNGVSYTSSYTINKDACGNSAGATYAWVANNAGGTTSAAAAACQAGVTYIITYTVTNSAGVSVSDSVAVSINGTSGGTWSASGWSSCSASCTQNRTVVCVDSSGNTLPNSSCPQPPPSTTQTCTGGACTGGGGTGPYSWHVDSWGVCMAGGSVAACGQSGTQTRSVYCQDSNGNAVADSYCPSPKPAVSQPCSGSCTSSYYWDTSAWSACSATTCNTSGTQTRTVVCRSSAWANSPVFPDIQCASAGPKPPTTQSCLANSSTCTGGNVVVDIWADSTSISSGQSTVIHWSVANSTSAELTSSPVDPKFNYRAVGNNLNASDNSSNLTQPTKYTITAQGPGGPVSKSVTINVTGGTVPGTPGGGGSTVPGGGIGAGNCGRIDLSWSDVSGETGYRIYRNTSGIAPASGSGVIATLGANTTTYSNTGLSSGTYYYWVSAYNSIGDSGLVPLGSQTVTECGANLSTSDKDIIGHNGTTISAPGFCDNSFDLPPSTEVFHVGDTVKFRVRVCNSSTNTAAANILVTDYLINLVKPDGAKGWDMSYGGVALTDSGSNDPAPGQYKVTGTAPNQVLIINLPGNVPMASASGSPQAKDLIFTAKVQPPAGFNNNLGRFQNRAVLTYNRLPTSTTRDGTKTSQTGLVYFYSKGTSPDIIEVAPH